ncbi:hypothetical protein B484DRAFT_403303, partial [Ochromonadaceae sp. CCMP2298]
MIPAEQMERLIQRAERHLTLHNLGLVGLSYTFYSILHVLYDFVSPREDSLPEFFPLQNTWRLFCASDKLLDWFMEYSRLERKRTGK